MDTKNATILGIAATFLLGLWNLYQNLRSARRTNFINTVTAQRIKWIEQLRQDISAFSGLTYTWCLSNATGKPEEFEMLKEIDRLRYVIRLRLNPSGKPDGKIEQLLEQIPKLTNLTRNDDLAKALEELTTSSQRLLKEEWEQVKWESEHGNLKERTKQKYRPYM